MLDPGLRGLRTGPTPPSPPAHGATSLGGLGGNWKMEEDSGGGLVRALPTSPPEPAIDVRGCPEREWLGRLEWQAIGRRRNRGAAGSERERER